MVYSVLTPPPGFDGFRHLQANLERRGRFLALALPPLVVLGAEGTVPGPAPDPGPWTLGSNGWKLGGSVASVSVAKITFLTPEDGWLLLPWDTGPAPDLEPPQVFPKRKLTWGLLEIDEEPCGIRWRWLSRRAVVVEGG